MSYGPEALRTCDGPGCGASYDAIEVMTGRARATGWRQFPSLSLHMCGDCAPRWWAAGDGPHVPAVHHTHTPAGSVVDCACGASTGLRRTLGELAAAYLAHLAEIATTPEEPMPITDAMRKLNSLAPMPERTPSPETVDQLGRYLTRTGHLGFAMVYHAPRDQLDQAQAERAQLAMAAGHLLDALYELAPEAAAIVAAEVVEAWHDGGEVGSRLWSLANVFGLDANQVAELAGEHAQQVDR
ncbi:MAG TPA: hypothetical protein VGL93_10390 [Streptosporangiaceae bacterium]|jgi:hypothetical protein